MKYRYPTLSDEGRVTHVLVPVEDYLRMQAADDAKDLETTFPIDVAHPVLNGTSPIRAWREHLNMTQAELAKKTGKTAAAISRLEDPNRTPRIATLRELAAAFGLEHENMLIKLYD